MFWCNLYKDTQALVHLSVEIYCRYNPEHQSINQSADLTFPVKVFFDRLDSFADLPVVCHIQLYHVDILRTLLQTSRPLAVDRQAPSEHSEALFVQIQCQAVSKAAVTTYGREEENMKEQFFFGWSEKCRNLITFLSI